LNNTVTVGAANAGAGHRNQMTLLGRHSRGLNRHYEAVLIPGNGRIGYRDVDGWRDETSLKYRAHLTERRKERRDLGVPARRQ
jgi:hypothetical protein